MKILSFDVSSTTTGWALLEYTSINDIKTLDYGFVKPPKDGSIIQRLAITKKEITDIILKAQPDNIAIEDLIQFMSGGSTATTIITLTSFNRMIGLLAHDLLNKEPFYYSVMTIRHAIKLSKPLPPKEDIPELVAHYIKQPFPYYFSKPTKKKVAKIQTHSYDVADAFAVGIAHIKKTTNE